MTETAQRARAPFHLMTKPIGPICNLGCEYCFYLEKEALFGKGEKWRMSDEVLERYVRQYIEAQPVDTVTFAWQGGEPTLLGVDFFRKAVALEKKYAGGKRIENSIQTNGTLLDEEWCAFFKENGFLVGISVDGPQPLHDTYRVTKNGKGSYDKVMRGLELLKKHGVEYNTLTVVNRANSQRPDEVYRFLRNTGSQYIQFIPLVERRADAAAGKLGLELATPPGASPEFGYREPEGNGGGAGGCGAGCGCASGIETGGEDAVTDWSVRPVDYGNFLCAVYDRWVQRDVGRVYVQHFDTALAKWLKVPGGVCHFAETCGRALAIEHDGNVYACDHYVYPGFRMGNVLDDELADLVDSGRMQNFGNAKRDTLPRYCRECEVRFACNGECPKHRFTPTPDGEPGLNYLCAGYKRFFKHIAPGMEIMAGLYRQQRSPAEIMPAMKRDRKLLAKVLGRG